MSDTIRINKIIRERIDTYKSELVNHYLDWSKDDPRWEKEYLRSKEYSDIDIIEIALWMAIIRERELDKQGIFKK